MIVSSFRGAGGRSFKIQLFEVFFLHPHLPAQPISSTILPLPFNSNLGVFLGYLISFRGQVLGQPSGKTSVNSWSGSRPGMAPFAIPPPLHRLNALLWLSYGVDRGLTMD